MWTFAVLEFAKLGLLYSCISSHCIVYLRLISEPGRGWSFGAQGSSRLQTGLVWDKGTDRVAYNDFLGIEKRETHFESENALIIEL